MQAAGAARKATNLFEIFNNPFVLNRLTKEKQ